MRPYEPATLPVVNLDYQMLFGVLPLKPHN